TAELGQADAWLQIVGGYDPSREQILDDPWSWQIDRRDEGTPVNPEQPPLAEGPGALLPPGARVLEVAESHARVRTAAGIADLPAYVGDAADPVLRGRFELLSGRAPENTREILASPGALDRLGVDVGDTIRLADTDSELTVAGTLKVATQPDRDVALFLPDGGPARESSETLWFAEGWRPTTAQLKTLNQQGFTVYSRALIEAAHGSGQETLDPGSAWILAALLSAAAAFCGYLAVMLAGAAVSVSARRQQRSLAVAASVGADRADLFRIVLLQGAVLGALGGVLGAAAGVGLGVLALRVLGDGSVSTFWGVHIPWPVLVGVVLFAIVVGTASALMPARAATRGDTLAALRGACKPVAVRFSRPLWGSLLIMIGIGATAVSGVTLAVLNAADVVDDDPVRMLCLYGVIGGPILFQVGVLLGGHWLLSLIQRGLSPLGLAPRLAGRDAAANPGRMVPAFSAIAACTFLASTAIAAVGVTAAAAAREWTYQAPVGSAYVVLYVDGASEADINALVGAARSTLAATDPVRTAEVLGQCYPQREDGSPSDGLVVSPRLQRYADCDTTSSDDCHTTLDALTGGYYRVGFIAPNDLTTALGADPGEAARSVLRDGGALVTDAAWLDGGTVELNVFTGHDLSGDDSDAGTPTPVKTTTVPAMEVKLEHQPEYSLILSPKVAESLGMTVHPARFVAAYDGPAPPEVLDRIDAAMTSVRVEYGGFGYGVENGPPEAEPWLWLILGGTAALVIGASAVALGLARVERRPDDATLTAVGASTALRRGISFWHALIVTGLGGITGAIAGLLPVWGAVLAGQNVHYPPQLADTPWGWLAVLALGLPLAIAVVSWLVPPRHPDLTRRTAIA
ncbi:MAG: hypothetical protein QM602_01545, partial [Microbacterium sp.]